MAEKIGGVRIPPVSKLIAGGLVVLGLLLSGFVSWGFFILAGLGAFGPGILRELGWLRDQDEFQRQATYRAGYLAYLVGGIVAVVAISALKSWDADLGSPEEWLMLVVIILWMTWLFSSMLSYWGARKTASRVLRVFGSFWAVFVLAMLVGSLSEPEGLQLVGVLMGFVFVAPFFVLAWMAGRRPRATGMLLVAVTALFLLIVAPRWTSGALKLSSVLVTATLLVGPLIISGIALLREGRSELDKGEEPAESPAESPAAG